MSWVFSSTAQVGLSCFFSGKFHFDLNTMSFQETPLPLQRGSGNATDLNTAEKPLKQTDRQERGYNKWASAKLVHVTRGECRE